MITYAGRPCFVCDICGAHLEGEGVYAYQPNQLKSKVYIAHVGMCAEALAMLFDGEVKIEKLTHLISLLNPKDRYGRVLLKTKGYDVESMTPMQVLGVLGNLGYVWRDGWYRTEYLPCISIDSFSDKT